VRSCVCEYGAVGDRVPRTSSEEGFRESPERAPPRSGEMVPETALARVGDSVEKSILLVITAIHCEQPAVHSGAARR